MTSRIPERQGVYEDVQTGAASVGLRRRAEMLLPEVKSPELRAWLQKLLTLPALRDPELMEIRDHFEGGPDAISAKYHPKPASLTETMWRTNRRLLSYVNLVKPVQKAYSNAVYSGQSKRKVKKNPEANLVKDWVGSDEYLQLVEDWTTNKITMGTSVAVPLYDPETGETSVWLPDPVYTWIFTDKQNVKKIVGVAEVCLDHIQYVHLQGEGYISLDAEPQHEDRDFGWLPVVVGYGEDRRSRGLQYGLTMVRDAVTASKSATAIYYNIRLLQRQQTRSILKRIADLEELERMGEKGKPVGTGSEGSTIDLPMGGDAEFISPDPKIEESLKVLKQQLALLAIAAGIPADVLDSTLSEAAASAESARIRALPLIQNSRPLIWRWRSDEQQVILAMTARIGYHKSGEKPIDIAALRQQVATDIVLNPQVLPLSPNEHTQDTIARVSFGLTTEEDGILEHNETKSDSEIAAMAVIMRKRMADAGGPQAFAQAAMGGGRPGKAVAKGKVVPSPGAAETMAQAA